MGGWAWLGVNQVGGGDGGRRGEFVVGIGCGNNIMGGGVGEVGGGEVLNFF